MSKYANKAILSLLNMTKEMYRKNIEIRRITKTCALLIMSGLSKYDISKDIVTKCLESQKEDGGFIGNTDTLWNIKLLASFPEYDNARIKALTWLKENNGDEPGFGRSKRDMHRIPVTGLALFLLPELADRYILEWLELMWISEEKSLSYKGAYTILAFNSCKKRPIHQEKLIEETADWLVSQQAENGGYGPWLNHPVGENVYCTAVSILALISMNDARYTHTIIKGYKYLCDTQLKSGIWPYHEIEDGSAWGLLALSKAEEYLEGKL